MSKEPSHEEWNLASIALRAAQDSEAKRYAPKVLAQAQFLLKKGEVAYESRYYDEAADYFRKSRYYSEKAENIARYKIFKQGVNTR